jgi:hypothetical protein
LAFYRVFHDFGLTRQTKKLSGLWGLAQNAGWALPHEKICWVSERHNVLMRDGAGRLHNLSGPSVMYPDGWAIYAVHGVRVPGDIIEHPKTLTVQRIGAENNAEVKRVMMEIYGMDKYLEDSGATPIATDKDQFGRAIELYRFPDMVLPVVRVVNSSPEPDGTHKRYVLTATRQTSDPIDALASLAGTTKESYRPVLES